MQEGLAHDEPIPLQPLPDWMHLDSQLTCWFRNKTQKAETGSSANSGKYRIGSEIFTAILVCIYQAV